MSKEELKRASPGELTLTGQEKRNALSIPMGATVSPGVVLLPAFIWEPEGRPWFAALGLQLH